MEKHSNTSHIVTSLAANTAITIAKAIAAVFTGSGSLIAESIHSLADCGQKTQEMSYSKREKEASRSRAWWSYPRSTQ